MRIIIGCLFLAFNGTSQDLDSIHKCKFITQVCSYISDSLKLNVGENFYTRFNPTDSMYAYLYVSDKSEIKQITSGPYDYFGTHPALAALEGQRLSGTGYDVMVYQTAGTSAAFISKRLLQYDSVSIAFIIFHEAMHRHLSNSRIPYMYEEAICDLAGNYFTSLKYNSGIYSANRNEKIYRLINKCIHDKISKAKCELKLKELLKGATLFQQDRFNYPVNNAFLLRYRNYTGQYFVLKIKLWKQKDKAAFFREANHLPQLVPNSER